jgi:WD40 repeat protein/uncharacterized caspase-like protein
VVAAMPDERRQLVLPEPERRLALVIGVDAAPHARTAGLHNTLSATRDAEAMAQVLTESCGFELITSAPLVGEAATSAQAMRAVLQLERDRGEHDFLLLYFAGHGHLMQAASGQHDIFLVTHDFDEREVKAGLHFSMSWLRDNLYLSSSAGKILLILDCCYAGNWGRTAPDPYLEDLKRRINEYFGAPGAESGSRLRGLRQALAATTHNQLAYEQGGHGRFTALLLDALRGQVDEVIDLANHGYITLYLVQNYLQRVMPRTQRSSLSGDDAGKLCILAQNEQRAEQLRAQKRATVNARPQTYIPFQHNESFQQRPGEFDMITQHLLPGSAERSPIVGLTGMGGKGKSQLAVELALLYVKEQRFPDGIFWLPVTEENEDALCYQLSELAANAEYLPPDDDVSHPENRRRRARHFCRWLAEHPDALLILDNVQQIKRVLDDLLPKFVSGGVRCTILYTSRNPATPAVSVWSYEVKGLTEKGAWRLLLARREATLQQVLAGDQGAEAQAARAICNYVERLPLALTLLRDLLQDPNLTVAHLWTEQQKRGTIALTSGDQDVLKARLFSTFEQSWNRVKTAEAQRLFKLASVFPEAVPIPLWLPGIAANLPGSNTGLDALGRARIELQRWSMIEVMPNDMIRLHPLLREFGQYLLQQDAQDLRAFAEVNLLATFAHINKLEERARAKAYWGCLSDMQEALNYARLLHIEHLDLLERVASWLARESSLLGNSGWWPAQLPALFYQQLANHAVEESQTISGDPPQAAWLRLTQSSGAENQPFLHELRHPGAVTSVAFSPDGKYILTACDDWAAYLWNADNGQMLRMFRERDAWQSQAVFSPGGDLVATCSAYQAALWDIKGQLLRVFHVDVDTGPMHSIALSPDGKALAGASDKEIRIWDIDSGELIAYLTPPRSEIVGTSTFSPDGSQIMTCARDGTVLVWNIASEEVVEAIRLGNSNAKSAIFSSTGELLFICLANEGIVLWDRAHRQIVKRYANRYTYDNLGVVQRIALAPNEQYITVKTGEKVAQVWHVQSGELWCTYGHKDAISEVAFSPDSTRVATASLDHTVRIWEIPPGATQQTIEPGEDIINLVQFSLDGTRMLTATGVLPVRLCLWDVASGQMLYERLVNASISRSISSGRTGTALDHDGRRVIVAQPPAIIIYDIALDHIVTRFDIWTGEERTSMPALALSPDGRLLAASTGDERLLVLDTQNWQRIALLAEADADLIESIAFSSDGAYVAAGMYGGEIHVWDTTRRAPVTTLKGDLGLVALAISPDKQSVAVSSLDGTLQLWSLPRKKQLYKTRKHTAAIEQLSFSPDGRLLVSSDRTGQVLLWRVQQDEIAPAGIYITPSRTGAVHWQDARRLILADIGGTGSRPHFHRLTLEGFVENAS